MLLGSFIEGATQAGASVELFKVRDLDISPCRHCGGCDKSGICVIKDQHSDLADKIYHADLFVLSAPVFFSGYPAITKAFIDRFQAYWIRRYVLNSLIHPGPKSFLLSLGGTRGMKNFEGVTMTFKYLVHSVNGQVAGRLAYPEIDAKAAVEKHPSALSDGYEQGRTQVENLESEMAHRE